MSERRKTHHLKKRQNLHRLSHVMKNWFHVLSSLRVCVFLKQKCLSVFMFPVLVSILTANLLALIVAVFVLVVDGLLMLISGVHVHCRWLPLAMVSGGRCPAPVMPEPGTHHTACVCPWIILSSESLCPGYLAFATHQWTAPIRGPPVVLSRLTYSALTAAYILSRASSTEWASVRRAG